MDRLYGGVCYAGIDTDPELKYPKGAGRVAFSNQQSYIAAISARFVQLQHGDIDKRVHHLFHWQFPKSLLSWSVRESVSITVCISQQALLCCYGDRKPIRADWLDTHFCCVRVYAILCNVCPQVEVKPYVLDDQLCDECQGARCGGKFAPFFCANVTCLQYYCEFCWANIHSRAGREFHKPLVKEGADRPRQIHFRWN